ncbi:hypothetical protein BKA62DRAFT_833482 [Auriculariales sp. MPI-PUGE-AT-0066]|nr:hypothetical protein BKA62DRAFT_833482 [Auriculariales sp. MPI-PUGE-AT-0066]
MIKASSRGIFGRVQKKKETATIIRHYLAACHALSEILQAKHDKCGLFEEDLGSVGRALISCPSKNDLELEVRNLSSLYDGIKDLIRGMVTVTEGLPWPLKAVPQTFLQIVQHLEKGQAVAAGITQLLTEVQTHWDLVAEFHAPDGSNEKLSAHAATFFEVLFTVFIRLRVLQAAHPVASRIAVDSYNAALIEESQRVALAMRALESARDWTASNDIADVKKELQVLNQSATTDITVDLDVCSVPPPKPNVFHGRDDNVKSLVEKVIQHSTRQAAANLGILGNAGLGKTSLAQTVMWEHPIVEHFGSRRFFLSCEPLIDATGVGAALSKLFDVPASKDKLHGIITHLESHGRTLLVLDNLETVWLVPDDRARSQLELLLRRLAAIPTLTLIITSRGIVLPRGISWANVASATIEPFSAKAALQTFDDIAGTSENDEENERAAVVELIKDVDCMPLAVTLLAQLAQYGEKPSVLLRHWKKSHTTMLRSDPLASGRETNVAASIAVSIKLLTAGFNGEEPLQLLSICAHLPAGLRTSVFDQLESHFKDLDSARCGLLSLALISVGPQDELKVLSPIRHFVLGAHPMTADHSAAMRRIYFDIAASAPRGSSEEFATKSVSVAAEYENLKVFLLHLINTEEPSQSLIDAVNAIFYYTYWMAPSATLWEALRSRLDCHALWLAECCIHIGRIYLQLGEYTSASNALFQACDISRQECDRRSAAYCALLLGDCQQRQGFYEAAVQQYTAARDTFLDLQDDLNASACLMQLGSIALSQEIYGDAKQYLTSARSAFAGVNQRLYAANCTSMLGELHTKEGDFSMAETEFQTAQSEYQAVGNQWGSSLCMRGLGNLRRRQQDFPSAEVLLASAREYSTRLGLPLSQVCCIYDIGMLRRDQGRTEEALEAFRTAKQIYKRMGIADSVKKCERAIADLGTMEM